MKSAVNNRSFKGWIGVHRDGAQVIPFAITFAKTRKSCLQRIEEGAFLLTYPMRANVKLFGKFPKVQP